MKKNRDITKPRYNEQILMVPWPFVKSRFHCQGKNSASFYLAFHCYLLLIFSMVLTWFFKVRMV